MVNWIYGLVTMQKYIFKIKPIGAVRTNHNGHWKKAAQNYHAWMNELRLYMKVQKFYMPESNFSIFFYIPVSKSWSKKDKLEMIGKPHQQKPDKDNLEKAVMDTYFYKPEQRKTNLINDDERDDCCVWSTKEIAKFWCAEGDQRIEVFVY